MIELTITYNRLDAEISRFAESLTLTERIGKAAGTLDITLYRDDLRKRQDELEEAVRKLKSDVDRTNRLVETMRPLLCGLAAECPSRKPVAPADLGITKPRTKAKPQSIEPIDNSEL